jgi:DNA-binding Lrp family transcriptional regulator
MTNEPRPTSEDFKDDVKEKVRNVTEQIDLAADQVVDRVKELVNEGNIRSIRVKHDGKTIVEIPLTAAAVGGLVTVMLAPQIAILGAIAGLIAHVTIEVERTGPVEEIKETVIELKNDLTTKEPGTGEGI